MIRAIQVGDEPSGVSSDGSDVWVLDFAGGQVNEVDALSGELLGTFETGVNGAEAISSDGTHVWVALGEANTVTELDAANGEVIRTIPVGERPVAVSADGTDVWVANERSSSVSEIEASNGEVIRTIAVPGQPHGISSDGTHVWVTDDFVTEIDASNGEVVRQLSVDDEDQFQGISSDGTHVWVSGYETANPAEDGIVEVEASTGEVVRTIHIPHTEQGGVSSDGTHVWATSGRKVAEIDAATGALIHSVYLPPTQTVYVPGSPVAVSSDGSHVWVADGELFTASETGLDRTLYEIDPSDPAVECTSKSGTISLSPGLSDTPAVQTVKVKGDLTGCVGEPFTEATYTATLKTAGPVSCAALTELGEPATGTAKFKWKPRPSQDEPATATGPLSLPLTERTGVGLSGEITAGSYAPLTLAATVSEAYKNGGTCATNPITKPVKKGSFTASAVSFE